MDAHNFDWWTMAIAQRPSRRATLRLLAAGLLGAWLPQRGIVAVRAAQDLDSDQDGLFDDDEVNIYGTKPDVADTDGDGFGDGQEICNRDRQDPACQQDQVHTNPLVNEDAAPRPAPTCAGLGGACAQFSDCCPGEYVLCCFNASGAGICQDVSTTSFVCTNWADVPATGCAAGMTDCGGFCTNLSTDHGNCGACGHSCPIESICTNGTCVVQLVCEAGFTSCLGICRNTLSDVENCGSCDFRCKEPGVDELVGCENGRCIVYHR